MKAAYFIAKGFAAVAFFASMYCLIQVSPWALYGAFLLVIFKGLDSAGDGFWDLHMDEIRDARKSAANGGASK